jgi:hypothetical protein
MAKLTDSKISKIIASLPQLRAAGATVAQIAAKVKDSEQLSSAIVSACETPEIIVPFKNGTFSDDIASHAVFGPEGPGKELVLPIAVGLLTMADGDMPAPLTYSAYAVAYRAPFAEGLNAATMLATGTHTNVVDWRGQVLGDAFTEPRRKAPGLSKKVLRFAADPIAALAAGTTSGAVDLDSLMSDLLDF